MGKSDHYKAQRRNEQFATKIATRIWREEPSLDNPYISEKCNCHGYDWTDLMQHCSFPDMLYLLLRGELPTGDQRALLNSTLIALVNPGPRHPATRAAMNAGVGKTDPAHILPISLAVLGGSHLGGAEVEASMRFIKKHLRKDPEKTVETLIEAEQKPAEGDWHIAPGFGCRFGGIDIVQENHANVLLNMPGSGHSLQWGSAFADALRPHGLGWLSPGLAAAAFSDLGFLPRAGSGLFQLASAPGLLAHGLEFTNKPYTAMPFIDDANYVIETTEEER
jgi:citrate synthase